MPILGTIIPVMGMKPLVRPKWRSNEQSPTAADALFTTTQQRVLGLLFGEPSRTYYATELIRLTGAGSGAVQRELARLSQSALVTVRSIGNQKHYQANRDSPLFEELRSIVQKVVSLR